MINVFKVVEAPSATRIGYALVKYYDLTIRCDICLYKKDHFWVRMPEIWVSKTEKVRYNSWEKESDSSRFQDMVLKKVFDMIEWDIPKAVQIRKEYFRKRKELTKQINKITLQEKNSEE